MCVRIDIVMSLLLVGAVCQDPQWMPETMDGTESYIYYEVFFLYINTYDKS